MFSLVSCPSRLECFWLSIWVSLIQWMASLAIRRKTEDQLWLTSPDTQSYMMCVSMKKCLCPTECIWKPQVLRLLSRLVFSTNAFENNVAYCFSVEYFKLKNKKQKNSPFLSFACNSCESEITLSLVNCLSLCSLGRLLKFGWLWLSPHWAAETRADG